MKVSVAVHGRFHGFDLAAQLHRRGALARLITTYPAFAARRFVPADLPLATVPWLEAERRLWSLLRLPGRPDTDVARRFARFAARHLPECDLLAGWSGASLEAMEEAGRRGIKVVIERGSTHMDHQSEVLAEAYARWGLEWRETDPELAAREREEYARADMIALGSRHAADSFLARGFSPDRLLVNPYGVDLERFRSAAGRERSGKPRILFVGSVGVRKGVPELLTAFARLGGSAELHLIGPVEPGFRSLLDRLASPGVVVRGALPGSALPAEYSFADLFCLPSVEEGFGMVILQAMASGLPVIATTATGLPDADPQGRAGWALPPGDVEALADALAQALADERQRLEKGESARRLVEAGWSWDDYGGRAIEAYGRLLAGATA
ncbi:glycosyltransferase [Paramagnetospirillum caucaseum]|uniref:Glycosyltransferase n=1 Tax=Paramagnetospirillum caucaseum TaxID=1244869 RepID=M2Y7W9_9PROT|nr:glycosyltransferase family 4 protein [Paramagnetospirillum caucaseum]EME69131.1 glycosyltransferase [Paramagnetospirillum caucaseum]